MMIWSLRWSTVWGWRWIVERKVTQDTATSWLAIFRKDESGVEFKIAKRKPKIILVTHIK